MIPELDVYREHLERFRAVTLQSLDLVEDEDLAWRPGPHHYTLGQQFLHVAQAEDFQMRAILEGDRDYERVRFPREIPDREGLRAFFGQVRSHTLELLEGVTADALDEVVGDGEPRFSLRSWLWFVLEHEIHHKGQIALYLRWMGVTPPFFATPLARGERPDVVLRENLGGF